MDDSKHGLAHLNVSMWYSMYCTTVSTRHDAFVGRTQVDTATCYCTKAPLSSIIGYYTDSMQCFLLLPGHNVLNVEQMTLVGAAITDGAIV